MNNHRDRAGAALPPGEEFRSADEALSTAALADGRSIAAASAGAGVLLVFLRHSGCTFCKEALADIAARRARIEASGVRIVLVHMTPAHLAGDWLESSGLGGVDHLSDPDRRLYRAMGLGRGSLRQLFGLRCFVRGVAATLRGHIVGRLVGDGFQMPGAFLIRDGVVTSAYRHASAADRPDYVAIACALPVGGPRRDGDAR